MTERLCAACGELFGHTRRDAAYCSAACRQRAYRQRSTGRPRPVDTLIAELTRIADELERHGMYNDMAPAWGTLAGLAFGDRANDDLDAVLLRLRMVRGCLAAEERRRCRRADDQAMTSLIT
jgi:hypothetical protein